MGKGRRKRQQPKSNAAQTALLRKVRKLDIATRTLCIVSLITAVFTGILPLGSAFAVSYNYTNGATVAADWEQISPVLPLGYTCIPLLIVGMIVMTVLLWLHKPLPSLIGGGVATVGAAFLVIFAVKVGEVFAYSDLKQRGLQFGDLILRYYIALVPLVMIIAAFVCAWRAAKHREVAQIMASAGASPSITLGDAEE